MVSFLLLIIKDYSQGSVSVFVWVKTEGVLDLKVSHLDVMVWDWDVIIPSCLWHSGVELYGYYYVYSYVLGKWFELQGVMWYLVWLYIRTKPIYRCQPREWSTNIKESGKRCVVIHVFRYRHKTKGSVLVVSYRCR